MIKFWLLTIPLYIFSFAHITLASSPIVYKSTDTIQPIRSNLYIYEDQSGKLSSNEVLSIDSFSLNTSFIPNFGVSNSAFWIKFSVENTSASSQLQLAIRNPLIDVIELYKIEENEAILIEKQGDQIPFSKRKNKHKHFLLDMSINSGATETYLLRVKSWELLLLPMAIGTPVSMVKSSLNEELFFGLFFGIMMVLVLYNLFIYITVRDRSYLYYVIYILFILLTQASLNGYTSIIFFPNNPWLSNITLILFNSIAGITAVEFIKLFLKTKDHTPILHKGFTILTILYSAGIVAVFSGFKNISYNLMDAAGMLISFYTLFIAIKISYQGYRPAKIFLAAWTVFLIGIIFFVLKNIGLLPSNVYTNHTMTLGISIEGVLLSIALADRISSLRKEKEDAQERTLEVLIENEQIIKEQNVLLEQKVTERTEELNHTLSDLKNAQTKLVEAEKMSSLGQLTAGIAHEINNPINFVSSNINPLRQDINDIYQIIDKYEEMTSAENFEKKLTEVSQLKSELDYEYLKEELQSIINGIQDGAMRTTEIVSGLRNFSRLDESEMKEVDINVGIESTIILIRNKLKGIEIKKELNTIPLCTCNPGKINQLFMNLIDNSIYAIHKKEMGKEKRLIEITTSSNKTHILITFKDNGIGIPTENLSKLFDPFFTTKEIGEGSGLGLSIVHGIVDSHKGTIEVNSQHLLGTEIIIKLPTTETYG